MAQKAGIASWYRGTEPSVLYVDDAFVAIHRKLRAATQPVPSSPGWWWAADAGWHGPYPSEDAARQQGRSALREHARR